MALVYLALIVLLPQDKSTVKHYHVSSGGLAALLIIIIVPYLIIWLIALIGYLRFKDYTHAIRKSKDGRALQPIGSGILWLTLWLPLSAIAASITSGYYRAHPGATATMVILNNYFNILILLGAFIQIKVGSRKLLDVVKRTETALPQLLTILFIAFSSLYLFLVLHDPARRVASHGAEVGAYYLPDWLIVTTIVIPRLVTWYLGMQAIYNIYIYSNGVKGPIYKQALANLVSGLSWLILTVVVLRCFESLSSQLSRLSLSWVVLVIYALLALISLGYVLIAKGAQSLQRIEEI